MDKIKSIFSVRNTWLKFQIGDFSTIFDWIYPRDCVVCSMNLPSGMDHVCFTCRNELPYTLHESRNETDLDKLFWGRGNVSCTFALLHYQEGGATQALVHNLKYKGKSKLGFFLGTLIVEKAKQKIDFKQIDYIIPVPLHPEKSYKRGFNQTDLIAQGISSKTDVSVNYTCLVRKIHSQSQTKFGRFTRWSNVKSVFAVENPELLKNKHIVLIDDVITTGATLESCVRLLQETEPSVKVSILSLAMTK